MAHASLGRLRAKFSGRERATASNFTIRGYLKLGAGLLFISNSELQLALKRLGNRGAGVRDLKTRRQCQRIVRRREVSDYGIG